MPRTDGRRAEDSIRWTRTTSSSSVEYHAVAKTHPASIKQLLEELNDHQKLFLLEANAYEEERFEAKAYEEERLATMANRAPTTDEQESELATTTATEA